jgi:hypothetical protein
MNPISSENLPPKKTAKPAGTREGKENSLQGRGFLLYYVIIGILRDRLWGGAEGRPDAEKVRARCSPLPKGEGV